MVYGIWKSFYIWVIATFSSLPFQASCSNNFPLLFFFFCFAFIHAIPLSLFSPNESDPIVNGLFFMQKVSHQSAFSVDWTDPLFGLAQVGPSDAPSEAKPRKGEEGSATPAHWCHPTHSFSKASLNRRRGTQKRGGGSHPSGPLPSWHLVYQYLLPTKKCRPPPLLTAGTLRYTPQPPLASSWDTKWWVGTVWPMLGILSAATLNREEPASRPGVSRCRGRD